MISSKHVPATNLTRPRADTASSSDPVALGIVTSTSLSPCTSAVARRARVARWGMGRGTAITTGCTREANTWRDKKIQGNQSPIDNREQILSQTQDSTPLKEELRRRKVE